MVCVTVGLTSFAGLPDMRTDCFNTSAAGSRLEKSPDSQCRNPSADAETMAAQSPESYFGSLEYYQGKLCQAGETELFFRDEDGSRRNPFHALRDLNQKMMFEPTTC